MFISKVYLVSKRILNGLLKKKEIIIKENI
jgi:hypothetical protein